MQPKEGPTTIVRHAYAVYPPMAMLAGMQLDVFTPLKDGPMTATALANALDVRPEKLRPLLYALVHGELLLKFEGDRFANTPEADAYLVRGRATYMGGTHELYSDLWGTALKAAQSIRADKPQANTISERCRMKNSAHFSVVCMPVRSRQASSWQKHTASGDSRAC